MKRTAVINVVGLTESLLGEHTPRMAAFRNRGKLAHIKPAFPAVTCTAQSDYVTGTRAHDHGIVANGWYHRELAEVQFWKQSNHLVQRPKIWDELKRLDPQFTCAKLFWWYNMYSTADYSITPRPMYPADGRKVFDIYTWPPGLRYDAKEKLGEFPFPAFWGPAAGISTPQATRDAVSVWIAESAKWTERGRARERIVHDGQDRGDVRWRRETTFTGPGPWHVSGERLLAMWYSLQVLATDDGSVLWEIGYPEPSGGFPRLMGGLANSQLVFVTFTSEASGGD